MMNSKILTLIFIIILNIQIGFPVLAGNRHDNFPGRSYNVKRFGARGDNQTDDTKAIQSAINNAFKHGGGIIWVSSKPMPPTVLC